METHGAILPGMNCSDGKDSQPYAGLFHKGNSYRPKPAGSLGSVTSEQRRDTEGGGISKHSETPEPRNFTQMGFYQDVS